MRMQEYAKVDFSQTLKEILKREAKTNSVLIVRINMSHVFFGSMGTTKAQTRLNCP